MRKGGHALQTRASGSFKDLLVITTTKGEGEKGIYLTIFFPFL
jgi:hypothetical protein